MFRTNLQHSVEFQQAQHSMHIQLVIGFTLNKCHSSRVYGRGSGPPHQPFRPPSYRERFLFNTTTITTEQAI